MGSVRLSNSKLLELLHLHPPYILSCLIAGRLATSVRASQCWTLLLDLDPRCQPGNPKATCVSQRLAGDFSRDLSEQGKEMSRVAEL